MRGKSGRVANRTTYAVVLTAVFVLGSANPAAAWTQEQNALDNGGTAYCGGSTSLPCLFWKEPHYTSITVYGQYDTSLTTISAPQPFQNYLNGALGNFNSAPAYNPYMYGCAYLGCGPVAYYGGALDCPYWGWTSYTWTTVKYSSTWGYYAFFTGAWVTFENTSRVRWNESSTWSVSGCNMQADARYAARHETGHAQGLGHTYYAAIMNKGGNGSFYTLQPNDIAGLQGIYPGNQPAS